MVPRALLLSADEKVCGLLSSALPAATCTVDRCKDIFSAVEAITRDRFDLLLIDWHETLEANFLLTTARDLKSKSAIFAVGLVTPAQGREALENGVDAILVKPFTAAQAAQMLLPKLGIECPPAERGPEPSTQLDSQPVESRMPAAPTLQRPLSTIPTNDLTQPWKRVESTPVANYSAASEASPRLQSRRSRMLSLTAVVWPLIIAAALLVFDHWPTVSRHAVARISSLAELAHRQMRRFPGLRAHESQLPAHSDQAVPQSGNGNMPISDDLLSDYAAPGASVPSIPQDEILLARKPDDIDLASVEALPSSTRLIAPVFTLEPSRPNLEVPASLRFPPPAASAASVTPSASGRLVAPEWIEGPVALPETVSRALLEFQVMPLYPDQALKTGMNGQVVLQASIGKDGAIRQLKLVSGYLVLAHAAVDAVKQWRYKPYRRNGENVEVETLITVNFKRPPRG